MNESVFWIMNTLYGDCDLTLDQYNELLADVITLVEKWENILSEEVR